MSMFLQALLVATVYGLANFFDDMTGTQAITRPIILGTLTGLICGDITTGIIMGASLEAVYIGVSSIGGVMPTDFKVSSTVAVAVVILSGIPQETGLALAVAIGTLTNATKALVKAYKILYHPIYVRLAEKGNYKGFQIMTFIDGLFLKTLIERTIIFLCVWLGTDLIGTAINAIPGWVTNGLGVSANMLVVVGLCLTTQALWGSYTVIWVLLGFAMTEFLGLGTLGVAIFGLVIAVIGFKRDKAISDSVQSVVPVNSEEGGDFFG